jgi:hypothetical protein
MAAVGALKRWRPFSCGGAFVVPTRRGFPASRNPGVAVLVVDPDRTVPQLDDRRTFAFGALALDMAD